MIDAAGRVVAVAALLEELDEPRLERCLWMVIRKDGSLVTVV